MAEIDDFRSSRSGQHADEMTFDAVANCGGIDAQKIAQDRPFRMMWFSAVIGGGVVVLVGVVAALISMRPVFKIQPASVFAGR